MNPSNPLVSNAAVAHSRKAACWKDRARLGWHGCMLPVDLSPPFYRVVARHVIAYGCRLRVSFTGVV
eukprot:363195-Chlamydomonas_euryale.AAC.5